MDNYKDWLYALLKTEPIPPEDIPDIGLYMDQVTTLMDTRLAGSKRYPDDKILTKTMINNYTKNHLLPPSDKKKYSREHVFLLIMIYYLKSMLSISDIQSLLEPLSEKYFPKNEENGLTLSDIYQKIIDDYNSEQNRATIEKTFMDLMNLANGMDQEEQRYVREGFSSDEELSLYDLLFSENLSKQDIQKIKHVAVDLLAKVKAKIAELDHWTDKQETKAAVDNLIRDTLWAELPESYTELSISEYRRRIYEYVYVRYKEVA